MQIPIDLWILAAAFIGALLSGLAVACYFSVPDVCLYTGLHDDTVRAAMQNLERKGVVKPIDTGGRAADWQLSTSMWDVITGRR